MNPIDIVLLLAVFILVWRGLNIISAAREARASQRMAGEMREMYKAAETKRYISPFGSSMPAYPPIEVLTRIYCDDKTGITTQQQGLPRAPLPKNCQNCGAPATAPVCGHCGTHH